MTPDIDAVYFLTPVAVMAISFGPIVYLWRRGRLGPRVLLYAFIAYFSAIAAKYVVQDLTLRVVESTSSPAILGLYYGVQTSILEVGLAYAVVRSFRRSFRADDAPGYGLSLGMWENGVMIALPLLLDYIVYYLMIPRSPQLYSLVARDAPSLFLPATSALPLIGFSVLERISSLLLHLSWGYLAVVSVLTGRRRYVVYAMAMGFADFLVPFEGILGIAAFEALLFAMALVAASFTFLLISRRVTGDTVRALSVAER
ncbi:YhfC family glutamic-type intramembrane protease [Conexivisphaera calida]|uniref:Transporter n=1 Tax=Conexivisphaera calida TaxID=1874277 RepID=A0A4P2VCB0_9ARCH|nr:YhfC family glutamic-type intramembrane protease [Conexivisphaera calida]BBE42124.1 Transporter [Conexivisphaera calida]